MFDEFGDQRRWYHDIPEDTFPVYDDAPPFLVLPFGRNPLSKLPLADVHWFDEFPDFQEPLDDSYYSPPAMEPPDNTPDISALPDVPMLSSDPYFIHDELSPAWKPLTRRRREPRMETYNLDMGSSEDLEMTLWRAAFND